jgi:hypothetical protein
VVLFPRCGSVAKKPPTKQEARHIEWVASLPCLVCGCRATVHHVTAYADRIGRLPRSHQRVVPLCGRHHQAVWDKASDPQSVELLSHRGFYTKHGIDLYAAAERLWSITEARDG